MPETLIQDDVTSRKSMAFDFRSRCLGVGSLSLEIRATAFDIAFGLTSRYA